MSTNMKIKELFEFFPEKENNLKVNSIEVKKMSESMYSIFIDCSSRDIEITYGGQESTKGCFSSMYLSLNNSSNIGHELRIAERDVYFYISQEKTQLYILAILDRDSFENTLDKMESIFQR